MPPADAWRCTRGDDPDRDSLPNLSAPRSQPAGSAQPHCDEEQNRHERGDNAPQRLDDEAAGGREEESQQGNRQEEMVPAHDDILDASVPAEVSSMPGVPNTLLPDPHVSQWWHLR